MRPVSFSLGGGVVGGVGPGDTLGKFNWGSPLILF